MKHCIVALIALLTAACAKPPSAAPPRFMVQAVPVCGLLNNRGDILDEANGPPNPHSMQPDYRTVRLRLWKNGTLRNLGAPLGEDTCDVRGFNDRDEVAGNAYPYGMLPGDVGPEAHHMFLWQKGKYTELGDSGEVHAMNNAGVIVGEKDWPDGQRGFVFMHGKMHEVYDLHGGYFQLNAVNNSADMVGVGNRAVLVRGGVQSTLPLRPGDEMSIYSGPQAINDAGQIALTLYRENNAFYLLTKGKWARIASLPGYEQISFAALNNRGEIIGSCEHDLPQGPQTFRPFLWRDGKTYDLNDLLPPRSGWKLNGVGGLNDKGQISCSGTHNGKPANCLLSPAAP